MRVLLVQDLDFDGWFAHGLLVWLWVVAFGFGGWLLFAVLVLVVVLVYCSVLLGLGCWISWFTSWMWVSCVWFCFGF